VGRIGEQLGINPETLRGWVNQTPDRTWSTGTSPRGHPTSCGWRDRDGLTSNEDHPAALPRLPRLHPRLRHSSFMRWLGAWPASPDTWS